MIFSEGWLIGDLAREMGVSRSLVNEVMNGHAAPSDRFAKLAAKVLGVTPDEIREASPRRPVNHKPGDRMLRTRARRALMLRRITSQDIADKTGYNSSSISRILRSTMPPNECITAAVEELTGLGRRELFPSFYGFDGDSGEVTSEEDKGGQRLGNGFLPAAFPPKPPMSAEMQELFGPSDAEVSYRADLKHDRSVKSARDFDAMGGEE